MFPSDLPDDRPFDVITMLAVLEHIPRDDQPALAEACARALKPGGRLVVTTPAPAADRLLDMMKALHLIHGMELGQHYGFEPGETPGIFEAAGFTLVHRSSFEFRLNHLFVLERQTLEADR
jgi:SAM-dependent methyltransferase